MSQECTLVVETEAPVPFTCADGTGIEKGAILKLDDPRTAVLADGDEDDVAGIAAAEKIASDGNTTIPVYRGGIFKGTNSGGVTIGQAVATGAGSGDDNDIITATASAVGSKTLGLSLETATDGQTFLFELKPGCNNTAYA